MDKPFVVGALEILRGTEVGNNVVVVGGGIIGSEVALFLAEQGKKVTITTRQEEIALGLSIIMKIAFFRRLSKQDCDIRTAMRLEEIVDGGVIVSDRFGTRTKSSVIM